jgi:NADPH:quinone reductase-like Zn-dependent oxidoreductase
VEIKAISVNPVDYKVRATVPADDDAWKGGWDASGIVKEVGADVTLLRLAMKSGRRYHSSKAYAQYQIVDERIVTKPSSLSMLKLLLTLTTLTAWELLFDRLKLPKMTPVNLFSYWCCWRCRFYFSTIS